MVKSIDLSQLSITDANELIRQCGKAGEDVEVVNPDARHNIGVGLIHPINVRVKGSGGNAGEKLGRDMSGGEIYVAGNASELGADDLVIKLSEFREAVGHRIPVSIKMGGGRVRDDIKIAYKDGFDYVSLDGMQGGTGAASVEVLENVAIPTLAVLQEALDGLADIEAKPDMQIVIMCGIKDGIDAAKALALRADAVAVGTAALIAGGCIACQQCNAGTRPVGICTQDKEHEKRFDTNREAQNIHHFFEGMRWQLAAITDALGYDDVKNLSRDDLVALTPEAAAVTGLPYEPRHRDLHDAPLRKVG